MRSAVLIVRSLRVGYFKQNRIEKVFNARLARELTVHKSPRNRTRLARHREFPRGSLKRALGMSARKTIAKSAIRLYVPRRAPWFLVRRNVHPEIGDTTRAVKPRRTSIPHGFAWTIILNGAVRVLFFPAEFANSRFWDNCRFSNRWLKWQRKRFRVLKNLEYKLFY